MRLLQNPNGKVHTRDRHTSVPHSDTHSREDGRAQTRGCTVLGGQLTHTAPHPTGGTGGHGRLGQALAALSGCWSHRRVQFIKIHPTVHAGLHVCVRITQPSTAHENDKERGRSEETGNRPTEQIPKRQIQARKGPARADPEKESAPAVARGWGGSDGQWGRVSY